MKISEILKSGKINISFELFPPKADDEFEHAKTVVKNIASLQPAFMSVTYGAAGSASGKTIEIANEVQNINNITALAHLTCVASDKAKIKNVLSSLKEKNIHNILALRGDMPNNPDIPVCSDYKYASDLIKDIKANGDFCIGGACYPETHPESETLMSDIDNLKKKVEAGCDFLTTQMFFDNNLLYNFLYKIREAGITVPVIPGIMPITNANQVDRAMKLSGSFMPQRFKSLVDKFGYSPEAMKQAGIAYATDQIIDLYANGISNVHVYSMNNPDVAEKIQANLSDIINK